MNSNNGSGPMVGRATVIPADDVRHLGPGTAVLHSGVLTIDGVQRQPSGAHRVKRSMPTRRVVRLDWDITA
jgi:hypothetical protein